MSAPMSLSGKARDLNFNFNDSCNCECFGWVWRQATAPESQVYVHAKGLVEVFDKVKSGLDEAATVKRSMSNLKEIIMEMAHTSGRDPNQLLVELTGKVGLLDLNNPAHITIEMIKMISNIIKSPPASPVAHGLELTDVHL